MFKVRSYFESGITFVELAGRLDTEGAVKLKEYIDEKISGWEKLILEMGELSYISSSGLRILLLYRKTCARLRGRMILCTIQSEVEKVFIISGFNKLFEFADTREEAQAALLDKPG